VTKTESDGPPSGEPSGLLIVDKTCGPTSHDVVAVARRVLGTKAVGHTGTLDPMATGALLVVVGEATKLVGMLGAADKVYRTSIQLGVATRSLDAEGERVAEAPVPPLGRAEVEAALAEFMGEIDQVPPQVSAIKVDGQTAMQRARRGETVELAARRVRVDGFELHRVEGDVIELSVRCGKGFYVRSLARDLAARLGTLGHLTSLRREENAGFAAAGAVTFDELLRAAKVAPSERPAIAARLVPLREVCARLPRVAIDEVGLVHVRHGRRCPLDHVLSRSAEGPEELIATDAEGQPHAIVRELDGALKVLRGFR
jgi:tRNA pseudouridine55 synthase